MGEPRVRSWGASVLGVSANGPHDTPAVAPYMRGLAHHATKYIGEMRLIAHAAALGNRAERRFRGEHQSLRELDASAADPGLGARTERSFELPAEVADAEIEKGCEISHVDLAGQCRFDVSGEALRFPHGKSSAPREALHSDVGFTHALSVRKPTFPRSPPSGGQQGPAGLTSIQIHHVASKKALDGG